jgi:hypothetical protein
MIALTSELRRPIASNLQATGLQPKIHDISTTTDQSSTVAYLVLWALVITIELISDHVPG